MQYTVGRVVPAVFCEALLLVGGLLLLGELVESAGRLPRQLARELLRLQLLLDPEHRYSSSRSSITLHISQQRSLVSVIMPLLSPKMIFFPHSTAKFKIYVHF